MESDFFTISAGSSCEFCSSASAAAWAKPPPLPMASRPCSGSSTSPLPVMMSEDSRSAIASIASRRRSMRSVRQSLGELHGGAQQVPLVLVELRLEALEEA